jgi:hypothetical protein
MTAYRDTLKQNPDLLAAVRAAARQDQFLEVILPDERVGGLKARLISHRLQPRRLRACFGDGGHGADPAKARSRKG